jgi:transcriptional regulator with XRE-family HTH domain
VIIPNEKLQQARLGKRWSVALASRRVGVSANTFNRWERGLQIPQLATLDQLCAAFEMSAERLGFAFVVSPRKKAEGENAWGENVEYEMHVPDGAGQSESQVELASINSEYPDVTSVWPVAPDHEDEFSRRRAIASLIGMPAAILGAQTNNDLSLLRMEEVLAVCASHIPLCWQLYFEGGLVEVESVLPEYITSLLHLVRTPSAYQKRVASLLSQAYQLASLLATQRQDYGRASTCAQQGLLYGKLAEDPGLQIASFIRQALVFFYLKRARPRQQEYQKALQLTSQTSPLLQGRVYIGLVEVSSCLGQETEARHFLELAQKTFPKYAQEDPHYAYTHFKFATVSTVEGLMHLNLKRPDLAWSALEQSCLQTPFGAVPDRLELTVRQAAAACALGEMELTCQYIQRAVPLAHELASQLRIDESYEVYEQMLAKWGNEGAVKELEALFQGNI